MQIMLKSKKGSVILPVIIHAPEIEQEQSNEEFNTINGVPLNLKGGRALRHFTIASFFPSKDYKFANFFRMTLQSYINFFEKNRNEIIRVICVAHNGVLFDMDARVKFTYTLADKIGDVPYTLDITEYVDPKKKRGVLYDYI